MEQEFYLITLETHFGDFVVRGSVTEVYWATRQGYRGFKKSRRDESGAGERDDG